MRIDLHIHSTASDGSLSPGAVVAAARAGGLHVIAVADHDTVGGVAAAQAAAHGFVHVIPALELSTYDAGAEYHVLGYFVDPLNPALVAHGARASGARETRMHDMLERLGAIGVEVAFEDVLAAAGTKPESLGRPHLARALHQRGHVSTVSEAFDRYIGDQGPAFVPTALITPFEAIEIIHAAGGVAVWAHPRPDALQTALSALVAHGLDGVECYRPRLTKADTDRISGIAAGAGLFVTGGSDWHGEWQGRLGDFAVDRDEVAAFLDIGGI
ncbi:MAG TPA: PHP domain-containing protein [Longimicrobiales bacterium]|nr:PHP domain-containing protein [Longimicrobiales bacterium]